MHGGYLLAVPLFLGIAIWALKGRDNWWFSGLLVGVVLTYATLVYASYAGPYRRLVNHMGSATLTDQGLRFEVGSVVTEIPWASLASARRSGAGLMLNSRVGQRGLLLPTEVLSSEVLAFVFSKVRETGGFARDGA
jgi:hypothetical protein